MVNNLPLINIKVEQQPSDLPVKVGKKPVISMEVKGEIKPLPDDINSYDGLNQAITEKCQELGLDPEEAVHKVRGKFIKEESDGESKIKAGTYSIGKKKYFKFDLIWEVEFKDKNDNILKDKDGNPVTLKRLDTLATNVKVPTNIKKPDYLEGPKTLALLAAKMYRYTIKAAVDPSHKDHKYVAKRIDQLLKSGVIKFTFHVVLDRDGKSRGIDVREDMPYKVTISGSKFKKTDPKHKPTKIYKEEEDAKKKSEKKKIELSLFDKAYRYDAQAQKIIKGKKEDEKLEEHEQWITRTKKYELQKVDIEDDFIKTINEMDKAESDQIEKLFEKADRDGLGISREDYLKRLDNHIESRQKSCDSTSNNVSSKKIQSLTKQFEECYETYKNDPSEQNKKEVLDSYKIIKQAKQALSTLESDTKDIKRFAGQFKALASKNEDIYEKQLTENERILQKFKPITYLNKSHISEVEGLLKRKENPHQEKV